MTRQGAYISRLEKAIEFAIDVFDGDGYPWSAQNMRDALRSKPAGIFSVWRSVLFGRRRYVWGRYRCR